MLAEDKLPIWLVVRLAVAVVVRPTIWALVSDDHCVVFKALNNVGPS